jgi:hypothetical protein
MRSNLGDEPVQPRSCLLLWSPPSEPRGGMLHRLSVQTDLTYTPGNWGINKVLREWVGDVVFGGKQVTTPRRAEPLSKGYVRSPQRYPMTSPSRKPPSPRSRAGDLGVSKIEGSEKGVV